MDTYRLANEGSITGQPNCGLSDDLGYCTERFHQPGCGSAASPDIALGLITEGVYQSRALSPFPDSRGLVWRDQQFGSPMTLTDHVETATGQRQADVNPFSPGRRNLITAQRPLVFGDTDDPDAIPAGVPASTRRTVDQLAASLGARDHLADREAARRERDRMLARMRPARHPDYAQRPERHREPPRMVQFGGDDPRQLAGLHRVGQRTGRR